MYIHRQTLSIQPRTICWHGNGLADWTMGTYYNLSGHRRELSYRSFTGPFDRAITSHDGTYALIYQSLGTKGLLLKNGKLLREVTRSYYHADDYEYPAAFATITGTTYLIHCPLEYCRLDFEEVETGILATDVPGREPHDYFHSRLEVSPNGRYLLSKGWYWHPWDMVELFDLAACLANPLLLDGWHLRPPVGTEINSAGFISDELVVLSSSSEEAMDEDLTEVLPPESLAVWNLQTDTLTTPARVAVPFGNLFPLSETLAWDLFGHPKLLDLSTGAVVASLPEVATGQQCSSIVRGFAPAIAFDLSTGRVAVRLDDTVEILSVLSEVIGTTVVPG